jgi:hypothetical protein
MDRDKCDMESAFKFIEHNQTCYEIARAVANAKDEDAKAEKEALINKACEWLEDNAINYVGKDGITAWRSVFADFRKAMKGGEYE